MTSSVIHALKKLRHLPPPFNDMGPTVLAIATFSTLTFLTGNRMGDLWKQDFVSTYDGVTLWVTFPFALYMTISWGWSLLIMSLEGFCPSFIQQFKIQPKEDPANWTTITNMLPIVLLNQLVGCYGILYTMYMFSERLHKESFTVDQTNEVPSILIFALFWALRLVMADVWFYSTHRFLHSNEFLYKNIHARHHVYKSPTSLETAYMHPIESLITRYSLLVVIPHIFRSSLVEFYFWVCAVTFYQYIDHSGYWFPFMPSGLMHDYHHQRFLCCYGVIGFVDDLMGTSGNFHDYVTRMESESRLTKAL